MSGCWWMDEEPDSSPREQAPLTLHEAMEVLLASFSDSQFRQQNSNFVGLGRQAGKSGIFDELEAFNRGAVRAAERATKSNDEFINIYTDKVYNHGPRSRNRYDRRGRMTY